LLELDFISPTVVTYHTTHVLNTPCRVYVKKFSNVMASSLSQMKHEIGDRPAILLQLYTKQTTL